MARDRYLNVDDPRDPPAPAPDAQTDPRDPAGTPAPGETPAPAPESEPVVGKLDREQTRQLRGMLATPPEPTPAPESETDRCLRVMREVFLGQPGPHDLPSGVAEVERRLREGGK